jgi:hypothetical protein
LTHHTDLDFLYRQGSAGKIIRPEACPPAGGKIRYSSGALAAMLFTGYNLL